ncbi:MAG: hypothetical protein ACKVS7_04890 [Gemmatimonadaceae bacterium]
MFDTLADPFTDPMQPLRESRPLERGRGGEFGIQRLMQARERAWRLAQQTTRGIARDETLEDAARFARRSRSFGTVCAVRVE